MVAEEAQGEEAELAMFPEDEGNEKSKWHDEPADKAGPSERHDKKKKKDEDKWVEFIASAEPRPTRPQGRTVQTPQWDDRPQGR